MSFFYGEHHNYFKVKRQLLTRLGCQGLFLINSKGLTSPASHGAACFTYNLLFSHSPALLPW